MLVLVQSLDRYKQKWPKMLARVQQMDLCKHFKGLGRLNRLAGKEHFP